MVKSVKSKGGGRTFSSAVPAEHAVPSTCVVCQSWGASGGGAFTAHALEEALSPALSRSVVVTARFQGLWYGAHSVALLHGAVPHVVMSPSPVAAVL